MFHELSFVIMSGWIAMQQLTILTLITSGTETAVFPSHTDFL